MRELDCQEVNTVSGGATLVGTRPNSSYGLNYVYLGRGNYQAVSSPPITSSPSNPFVSFLRWTSGIIGGSRYYYGNGGIASGIRG